MVSKRHPRRPVRDAIQPLGRMLVLIGVACGAISVATAFAAQKPAPAKVIDPPRPSGEAPLASPAKSSSAPHDYKSQRFLLHTDLPAKEARELLARLEKMIDIIARYWGHPLIGTIECYVVHDLANWPAGSLDEHGRAKIAQRAGITFVETMLLNKKPVAAKAVVYAVADRGTPQHEAVHAYCGQTFGSTGPLWYAEGMAEMGQYWQQGDSSVHCHEGVIDYLRSQPPRPIAEILKDQQTDGVAQAPDFGAWKDYAWRWSLCHVLVNNPNYSKRFGAFGLALLTGQKASFRETYAGMLPELEFEYRFFVRHLDEGYRVDLCSWDWKHKFKEPSGTPITKHVLANRGWQPTGASVLPNMTYDYSASGTWQTSKDAAETTADGQRDGTGRLEGVTFKDYKLGPVFSLGAYGSFQPPDEGQLYVRCHDAWNALADNKGTLTLKIKAAGEGPDLPRPKGIVSAGKSRLKAPAPHSP